MIRACLVPLVLSAALCAAPRHASGASGAPWEGRVAVGGEIGGAAFGIVDLGLRKGPFSIQIFTDTLDLRYERHLPRGRFFVAARAEALAAGLLISPFENGGPALSRSLFASYAGAEGGWVRYLPASLYVGLGGATKVYFFFPRPETTVPVPGPAVVSTADVVLGRYTDTLHVWLRAGVDLQLHSAAPHVAGELLYRPVAALAPLVELRAAWAMNQDALTKTRLGGMNPYVVPLAGAAWAEWWVESYLAARLGLSTRLPMPRRPAGSITLTAATDVATFEGGFVNGLIFKGQVRHRRLFADLSVGYAPSIPRQEGISRASFFALLGIDWAELRRRGRGSAASSRP